MSDTALHEHIEQVILQRLDRSEQRRAEALHDFLSLSVPTISSTMTERISTLAPQLPDALYKKWVRMFSERFLETVQREHVLELCSGTQDNNAALCLVYLMFMESAKMEKQVAEDLYALGLTATPDEQQDMLTTYLKACLQQQAASKKTEPFH